MDIAYFHCIEHSFGAVICIALYGFRNVKILTHASQNIWQCIELSLSIKQNRDVRQMSNFAILLVYTLKGTVHRRRKRGGRGQAPDDFGGGGGNIPFAPPPNNQPTFSFLVYVKQ